MRRLTRKRLLRLLVLMIMIVGFAITLIMISASRSNQIVNRGWQPANQGTPPALLAQVVKEHIQPGISIDPKQMRIWEIRPSAQSQTLYLIDTRVHHHVSSQPEPLCGLAGCLFVAYISTAKQQFQSVFSQYLDPRLPGNIPPIQLTSTLWGGLPCLTINQLESPKVRTYKLCFNGQTYETIESRCLF
jgi:hypothetical protein